MDSVFWKKRFEFSIQLGGKRFVVRQNQSRTIDSFDYVCHREGLAGTSDAQKGLVVGSVLKPVAQFLNGLRLVACRFVCRFNFEVHCCVLLLNAFEE